MEITFEQMGHGAIPSPIDERDWTLASAGAPTIYPTSCFLDTEWMVASMQGKIGCCVGCTGEEVVRQIIYLVTGKQCNPGTPDELSFRFVYAIAKAVEGKVVTFPNGVVADFTTFQPNDEGTYPAIVAKIIRIVGVPLATFCPNDVSLDHETFVYNRNIANIPQAAFIDALTRKSGADFAVPVNEDGIKRAINYAKANKGMVMVCRRIGNTYWTRPDGTNSWNKDEILPIRIPLQFTGGHEESLTGYDYEPGTNRMRVYWLNHWSPQWADRGRGWEYADVWMANIVELRVSVAYVPVVDNFKYTFTKTLIPGAQGPDVVALQHVLKLENCYPVDLAFTGYFGVKTFSGVKLLQQKYANDILVPAGLTLPTGNVGPATLKWLNAHYSN